MASTGQKNFAAFFIGNALAYLITKVFLLKFSRKATKSLNHLTAIIIAGFLVAVAFATLGAGSKPNSLTGWPIVVICLVAIAIIIFIPTFFEGKETEHIKEAEKEKQSSSSK